MFSNEVRSALEAAGWTPSRKVSTERWVCQLTSEGFTMLPEAIALLESFGGLTVRPLRTPAQVYTPETIRFDPILSASGEWDRVDYWQEQLHTRLSPIADVAGAMLLLAEDGRAFSSWGSLLWLDGSCFADAMENTLIVGKRRPQEYGEIK
jgi:hypothetical protein